MNILLMTSDVFYIGRRIFRSFLTVIFLYFYFCKGWNACRFFYITKGTLIFAFAWHLERAWAWHSISVYISFAKGICNIKSDKCRKVHQYLTILTKYSQLSASQFSTPKHGMGTIHRPTFSSQMETNRIFTSQGVSEEKQQKSNSAQKVTDHVTTAKVKERGRISRRFLETFLKQLISNFDSGL